MPYPTTHGHQIQMFTDRHMAPCPEQKNLECHRPVTATALGDERRGRVITQALHPKARSRLSRRDSWAFGWQWLEPKGDVPKGGFIATAGDVKLRQSWWFVLASVPGPRLKVA